MLRLRLVVSAMEAKNSFDLDGWLAWRIEVGERGGVPLFAEEILMNAEERVGDRRTLSGGEEKQRRVKPWSNV